MSKVITLQNDTRFFEKTQGGGLISCVDENVPAGSKVLIHEPKLFDGPGKEEFYIFVPFEFGWGGGIRWFLMEDLKAPELVH